MHPFETENFVLYLLKNALHSLRVWVYRGRQFVKNFLWFSHDYFAYKKLLRSSGDGSPLYFYPQLEDRTDSHSFDAHYVYQSVWAFERILKAKPALHVDVGSLYEFLAYVSTITKVTFIDIRPVESDFPNIEFKKGSILELPYPDNSVPSLSCMHVAEHIGLGRYGDPLDPKGTILAAKEMQRVLAPGGFLYFSLPTGKQSTYFNAHRVHTPDMILQYFDKLELVELSGILDDRHLTINIDKNLLASARYGCGLYLFRKK